MACIPVPQTRVVHGHLRAFLRAGSGPPLQLVHGIGNSSQTWVGVLPRLAGLSVFDVERVTVVGHSLGGIALQFAYQFPERCECPVLVGSGGLGPELSAGLRRSTLPGAEWC